MESNQLKILKPKQKEAQKEVFVKPKTSIRWVFLVSLLSLVLFPLTSFAEQRGGGCHGGGQGGGQE